jgi:hypothetical protein
LLTVANSNPHFSHWVGEPREVGLKSRLASDFVI